MCRPNRKHKDMESRKGLKQATNVESYDKSRFNALRHGVLSRYTVLPWEDVEEYKALLDALVVEHSPNSPTQEHLVEEITSVLWRKRRLRMAEGAVIRRRLTKVAAPDRETIAAALIEADIEKLASLRKKRICSVQAQEERLTLQIELLNSGQTNAFAQVINNLNEETRKHWAQVSRATRAELLPFDIPALYRPDKDGLADFLQSEKDDLVRRRTELENSELIIEQLFGEAFKPTDFDDLVRYENHLDRKLERMLTMLLRLKELMDVPNAQ